VCLCEDGWLMFDWWVEGRVTNCALFMLCKQNVPLITHNAWPAYNWSFHMNCTAQTSVIVIIINLNFMSLSKGTTWRKTEWVCDQCYKQGFPVNFILPHFHYKRSCFFWILNIHYLQYRWINVLITKRSVLQMKALASQLQTRKCLLL
jgi:hypothetical protein